MSTVLGISCYYHDSAAALVGDSGVLAAAQEERLSRRKNDSGFPVSAIASCLRQVGMAPSDVDMIAFYEKPVLRFDRFLQTTTRQAPFAWEVFRDGAVNFLRERLWIKEKLAASLHLSVDRILFVEHHLAHAASAWFCSPVDRAALLTVDGVGEWTTTAVGEAISSSLRLDRSYVFPIPLDCSMQYSPVSWDLR